MREEAERGASETVKEPSTLRRRAEARVRSSGPPLADMDVHGLRELVHELHVHQEELRLQNEALLDAQEDRRAAHERYLDLFQWAPMSYLIIDSDGVIAEANHCAARMLETARESLAGSSFARFAAPGSEDIFYLHCHEARQTGMLVTAEMQLLLADGSCRDVELRSVATAAEPDLVCTTLFDLTERNLLQSQLAQVERLSRMGMLAASVGHEINNPLSYTLYNLQVVASELPRLIAECHSLQSLCDELSDSHRPPTALTRDPSELVKRVQEALEGAERIRGIARTLSSFARADDTERHPVDVQIAAKHACKMAQNEIGMRAHLRLELGPTPYVVASEGALAQVFLNLLVNAAHAIAEGDVDNNEIGVRTKLEGDQVVAEVRDTGCGIPPANLERLFDPFFTTKPMGQGSGLGLSITKKLITEMGGTISCESTEGKGTTFVIRLPAAPPTSRPTRRPASSDRPSSDSVVSGPRGRILVVDDDASVLSAIERMLVQHDVLTSLNATRAREILEKDQAFDLIILDLMMPGVSGMDLHRWLVDQQAPLADRVLFVTGGVFTQNARRYLAAVPNRFVEKPFNVKSFRRLVAQLITARGGSTEER